MEVQSNNYSYKFNDQDTESIKAHVRDFLVQGKGLLNNNSTVEKVTENICKIINEWIKETENSIKTDSESRSCKYVFKKAISYDDVTLVQKLFTKYVPYMGPCETNSTIVSSSMYRIKNDFTGGKLAESADHALFPWLERAKNACHVTLNWREDHPALSLSKPVILETYASPLVNRVNASTILNGLWQEALEGKGVDLTIAFRHRTFNLHSLIVKHRLETSSFEKLPVNEGIYEVSAKTLEAFFKYLYVGDEALESLELEDLIELFACIEILPLKAQENPITQYIGALLPATAGVESKSVALLRAGFNYSNQQLVSFGLKLAYTLGKDYFMELINNSFAKNHMEFFKNNADATVDSKILKNLGTVILLQRK